MKWRRMLLLASFPFLAMGLSWALSTEEIPRPNAVPSGESRGSDPELTRTGARRTLVVRAIDRVMGAVVNIHSERPGQTSRPIQGMGTGIVIDPRGYIVTNQHVVDDVILLRCRLYDGRAHNAMVVARNNETDLALIKIDPVGPLAIMPLGTANDLMLGETVVAIGNAFGYEGTVSMGIVSAVKRDVNLNPDMKYKSLIQTDASINPGNSGGPLINVHGELVGVNVAIRDKAQGIGFAIPVDNMIRSVAEMLHSRRRTYDGMVCDDRLDDSGNGLVRTVVVKHLDANSPASAAGLEVGDVMQEIGGVQVLCSYDVERAVLDRRIGDKLAMVVRRKDKEQRLEMVLTSHERMGQQRIANDMIWARLGVRLVPVPIDQISQDNKQLHGGLAVTTIDNDGVAAKAGIRKGDILVGLHDWETVSVENVTFVLAHAKLSTFLPLSFYILRAGQIRKGTLPQVN
jgi:serine protease Do